jgi:hypothetical protein
VKIVPEPVVEPARPPIVERVAKLYKRAAVESANAGNTTRAVVLIKHLVEFARDAKLAEKDPRRLIETAERYERRLSGNAAGALNRQPDMPMR